MIGKTISHYKILEKLGEGGMGVVYNAEDLKLKRIVALKFLSPFAVGSEEGKTRFFHEAQAAAALDDSNICSVHEIEEVEGQTFIVMAYVAGQSLKEKIAAGPLKIEDAVEIALQIAEGLQAAHEKGIVHRDVKPANILLTSKGQVRITDFGLAKLAGRTRVTKTGTTMGTAAYMSPEQAQGTEVDHRTDIWALGAVIYEMITGKQPFVGDYEQAVMYSIVNEDPEPLTALRTGVPMELERIVLKTLEKDPAERYQHMDELQVDLIGISKKASSNIKPKVVPGQASRPGTRKLWYGASLILAAVVTVVALYLAFQNRLTDSHGAINSIGVLPLDNLSGDPQEDYFVEGMHEALITDLSKISALRVISRTSAMRYKETDKSITEIGHELNVDVLVEGSVLRVGEQVRISAQLIRTTTDEHLWAGTYDRDLKNILALISEVAQDISKEIEVVLTPEEQKRLNNTIPVNPKAHEAYLKGRYFANKFTPKDFQTALQNFQEAIKIDSSYALAWSGLAFAHTIIAYFGNTPAQEHILKARSAALRAIELDNGIAASYTALGWVRLFEWDWDGARNAFLRALELNPNDVDAQHGYGDYLTITGRPEEGLAHVRRGWESDPFSPIYSVPVAAHLFMMRRYDEALAEAKRQLELDPALPGRGWLAQIYWQKGMYDEAMDIYREIWQRDSERLEALKHGFAENGPKGAMREVANVLVARSQKQYVNPFDIASTFARAGEGDRALEWLEKAYNERIPELMYIDVRPQFDLLHSDPRYQDLLSRMRLPRTQNNR